MQGIYRAIAEMMAMSQKNRRQESVAMEHGDEVAIQKH